MKTEVKHAAALRAKDEQRADLERQLRTAHQTHAIKVAALQDNVHDGKNEIKRLAAELGIAKKNAKFWYDKSAALHAEVDAAKKAKNAALIVASISIIGNVVQASES